MERASIGAALGDSPGSLAGMATTLHVVRHGETDWNRERRVQGHTDVPLNEEGRRQALALAEELSATHLDAVYSSDLLRASETARLLLGKRATPLVEDPDLRERHFGTWEGLTDEAIRARYPQAVIGSWGDAETVDAMDSRVIGAIERIARSHDEGTVLVVTHGGPIRALYRHAGIDPPIIGNCAVATFVFADGRLSVRQ
jgi:2,3-bisphosphoglycerate-dependent phosphoglycerate mutase